MRKFTMLILFLSSLWGYSQVKNYTFTKTTGTYSEITGGTVLGNETTDKQRFVDPNYPLGNGPLNMGAGFPIGFNFTFNGYVYNRFAVAADGWISLGNTTAPDYAVNTNIADITLPLSCVDAFGTVPEPLQARIAALGKDLMAQTGSSISYLTSGVSPNRVLVVQWKKYKKAGTAGAGDEFNFQIRLNETTNTVDIVYGSFVSNVQPTAQNYQVGLRAEPGAVASNFVNRKSTTGWGSTTDGTAAADAVLMNDLLVPSSGLTYTWTPPTCGSAGFFVANSITINSANLNWGSYTPVPDSYEYYFSTSSTMPAPTFSGTATTNKTASLSGLTQNTSYNVFLRTKCGSAFTPWVLGGTFKTLCPDAVSIYEDFDSYDGSTLALIPDCWFKTGTTGNVSIFNSSVAPGVVANKLKLAAYAIPSGSNNTTAYGVMPTLSNLQAGTNRLRFKAYTIDSSTITLDVGYFTDSTNASSFVLIKTVTVPGITPDKAIQFIVTPDALPAGVKNLVFRNKPTAAPANIYIDDVVWEPTPYCGDVSALTGKAITNNSIDMSWVKGSHETAWQYVYAPASATDPTKLTPVDTYTNPVTVSGLNPGTTYKIWIRSSCDEFTPGAWIGPYIFTTLCAPASQFMENFDGSTTLLPSCWRKVGTTGSVFVSTSTDATSPSYPTHLSLNGSPGQGAAIVALPLVDNATNATNRLKFKLNVSVANSSLDVGYLTDVTDPSSFVVLETINSSTTTSYDSFGKSYGSTPKSNYLAFRNPGLITSIVNLDDIVWETISACPNITDVATTAVTSTTASLSWTAGGSETAWQYAVGTSNQQDPFQLTPVNVSSSSNPLSATINNLTPNTSYKVWMRSKCGTSPGSWVGPVTFKTLCTSGTDFSENFDTSSANLPACWSRVSSSLTTAVILNTTGTPSAPNVLNLRASTNGTPAEPAVCAMPPVSNAGAGTYRLKFKSWSTTVGCVLEVGFLPNPSSPASFAAIKSFTATQNTAYDFQSVDLGMDATTDVLAFRVTGSPVVGAYYIDDVVWEPIPACADVKNLAITGILNSSIGLKWDAGDTETNWQYAIGSASLENASTLTPVDVTSKNITISGLTSLTSYKVWIRSKCGPARYGAWVGPITFTTTCAGVDSFSENFDSSTNLPACWIQVGSKGVVQVVNKTAKPTPTPLSTSTLPNALKLYSQFTNSQAIVALPPVNNAGTGDHVLNFKYNAYLVNTVLEVGFVTNISDPNSFVPIKSITIDSIDDFKTEILSLGNSPLSNVLAFRHTGTVQADIYIDNVSWDVPPHAVPACATAVGATPDTKCGNYNTAISWNPVVGADGYKLTVGTTPGGSDVLNDKVVGGLSYSVASVPNKTYYYSVKPFNSFGTTTGCEEKTYTTNPNTCYCKSVPEDVDGTGVTQIVIEGTSFQGSTPINRMRYIDLTSTPVNVARAKDDMMQVTFSTNTYVYDLAVYIDLNDNFIFESPSEVFYTGQSTNTTPNTVPVPFKLPETAPLGTHRMRICSARSGWGVDSCNNGLLGVTLDFTVNVMTVADYNALSTKSFDDINFSYYPNPVKDVLNLSFDQEISNVSVVNLLGQQVISKTLNTNQGKIDMSHLPVGTYLVRVAAGSQLKTIKVVKE